MRESRGCRFCHSPGHRSEYDDDLYKNLEDHHVLEIECYDDEKDIVEGFVGFEKAYVGYNTFAFAGDVSTDVSTVEKSCAFKQTMHILHIGHVPSANFAVFFHNSFFSISAGEIIFNGTTQRLVCKGRNE